MILFSDIIYEKEFDAKIKKSFEKESLLYASKDKEEKDPLLIEHRITSDTDLLRYIFHSHGYMDVEIKIYEHENNYRININEKTRYKINKINVDIDYDKEELMLIKNGDYLNFSKIDLASEFLLQYYKNNGYPFAKINNIDISLNKINKTADLIFDIDTGKKYYINDIICKENKDISKKFFKRFINVKKGSLYNEKEYITIKRQLIDTGLFSYISIKPKTIEDDPDKCNLFVKTQSATSRFLDISAAYSTADNLSGEIEWVNKNFMKNGEEISIKGEIILNKEKSARVKYTFPISIDKRVIFRAKAENELDVYNSHIFSYGIRFEKDLTDYISFYIGGRKEFGTIDKTISFLKNKSIIKKHNQQYDVSLLNLPIGISFNNENDQYAPTKGSNINIDFVPYLYKDLFYSFKGSISHMAPIGGSEYHLPKFVWFNKISCGHLFGNNLNDIPPKYRFYLGGEDSIRSFGDKMIGIVDLERNAIGLFSYLYAATEFRFMIKEDLFLNTYYEAAKVKSFDINKNIGKKNNSFKKFDFSDNEFFHGVGISIYYYFRNSTQRIPVQFGVAFPMNPRKQNVIISSENKKDTVRFKRIDNPVQIYASISQIR